MRDSGMDDERSRVCRRYLYQKQGTDIAESEEVNEERIQQSPYLNDVRKQQIRVRWLVFLNPGREGFCFQNHAIPPRISQEETRVAPKRL
jgi:hypothetical protein